MNTISNNKEFVTWKSLKSLPRFYDFLEDNGYCRTCAHFEVDDDVFEATFGCTKEELFHQYKSWYLDNV